MTLEPPMASTPIYEITASIDVARREHAKTYFTKQVSSGRSLRARLKALHADGYRTTVRMPSGVVFAGERFPSHDLMDPETGYGPKPEHEHLMQLVEDTWMLRADPSPD